MPETAPVKDELAHLKPRKKCDRLAELSALVRMTGSIHLKRGGFDLGLATANPAVARKTLLLLKDLFDIDTELVTEQPSPRRKKPNYIITVPSQTGLAYTLKKSRILNEDSGLTLGLPFEILADKCCQASYLRGAFLAAGSVTATRHGYHLEISTPNETLAEDLLTLMEETGFPAKLNERSKDFAVYMTDITSITDFLALIGAHKSRLDIENKRIIKEFKGEVNRIVNAETANLKKTAAASVAQVADIKKIDKKIGIDKLPPALRDTARARLKYQDASTAELGNLLSNPITKSAVNHRLRRISAIARQL
jgi:DNA-binding protein WhiA